MITKLTTQQCTRCVMDTSARDITFDQSGVCSYCTSLLNNSGKLIFMDSKERLGKLEKFVAEVKSRGSGKKYDCIVGLSGGVDSAFTLVRAIELGLRPLAVHMDNGWNSELAQSNIENLVRQLGVDLYTHVIDWREYRNLMEAFFDADVVDVELLYDNAMLAANYKMAAKYKVDFILSGHNAATEGMRMPPSWNWLKFDARNIRSIVKTYDKKLKIDTFPIVGTLSLIWYRVFRKISWVRFLDFVDFEKSAALEILERDFNYKPYPYKHYESVFTRFYQGYLLPKKFSIDKRRVHLSTLIITNQMTRNQALIIMQQPTYPDLQDQEADINFFLKKMDWDFEKLSVYIKEKEVRHDFYGSEKKFWNNLHSIYKTIKKIL